MPRHAWLCVVVVCPVRVCRDNMVEGVRNRDLKGVLPGTLQGRSFTTVDQLHGDEQDHTETCGGVR